jgi:tRNA A-37 threonylcarbamoyl transferase component Bud32
LDDNLQRGQLIGGQFRIRERIGEGGMGVMYLAEQIGLERLVALKVIRAGAVSDTMSIERFKREARALGKLQHPNIVTVYAFGALDSGLPYLAMEFIQGDTLTQLLRWGPVEQERALDIAVQIARGLEEAHARGLVHRDLKPSNIMLTTHDSGAELVKVLDFGIVKVLNASEPLTLPGAVFGTPQYIAPEQVLGRTIDARTDLYVLGLILYEMLIGQRAFAAQSVSELFDQQVHAHPPRLRELPRWLQDIVMRCLEKDPAARFASAKELISALRSGPAAKSGSRAERWDQTQKADLPAPVPTRTRFEMRRFAPALITVGFALIMVGVQAGPALVDAWVDAGSLEPKLTFMGSNSGWTVTVWTPAPAAQVRYRVGPDGLWTVTGDSQMRDQRSGTPLATTFFQLPPSQRKTTLFIAWTGLDGEESVPYPLHFDPARERVAAVKRYAEMIWTSWVAFGPPLGRERIVYFTSLAVYRCGLQSIRYGLDGAPPSDSFELEPCSDTDGVFAPISGRPYITVPLTTQSITVDVTYGDGTHAQTRTFRAGDSRP